MKISHLLAGLTLLSPLLPLFGQSDTPAGEEKKEEVIQLSPFEVTTTKDVGYRAANSVSATRIDMPIADLPFAISAVTSEFIADTQSIDLYDAVRYAAGVTNGSLGFNKGSDWFTVRGFPQAPQHDGFFESSQGNTYVDMANIERVEVVKGPASLLYGQVSPGGTVNYITKRPEPKQFFSFGLSGGSYDFGRVTADINQPLMGNKLLFRMNAAWQNGLQYQELAKSKTTVLSPTLVWNITPKLALKVSYQSFSRDETPPAQFSPAMEVSTPASIVKAFVAATGYSAASGALTNKGEPDFSAGYNNASDPGFTLHYPGLSRQFNQSGANDWRKTRIESTNAELTYAWGDHWNLRANFNFNSNSSNQYQTGIAAQVNLAPPDSLVYNSATKLWSVAPAWNALTTAQQTAAYLAFAQQLLADPTAAYQLQNGTAAPVIQVRRPRLQLQYGNSRATQAEMAGNYVFRWGKLSPLFGVFYDASNQYAKIRQNTGSAASPHFQTWDVDPASPTYFVDHNTPELSASQLTTVPAGNNTLLWSSDQAAYAVLNGTFLNQKLSVVGGLRYNRSQSQTISYPDNDGGTRSVGSRYETSYTTPQFGAGYKLAPGLMIYTSYSESYTLPAQTVLRVANVPTTQAVPVTGKGYEVGLKTDFWDGRFSSTLALYQISQDNVVQTVNQILNGLNVANDVQGNTVRGQGIEYEVTWSPLHNFQVFASIAEEDIRNIAEPVGYQYYLGAHPQQTTKTLSNLWCRYTIPSGKLKGVWFGGGYNYVGEAAQDNRNRDLLTPAYLLWNSAMGYDWTWANSKMSMTINWQNMTNKDYQPVQSVPGMPERINVSLTAKF